MLSRNLFTSCGDDLGTVRVPNRNRIDGAGVARAQQPFPIYLVGLHEDRDAALVEHERLGRLGNAIAKTDAERAVDAHAQVADPTFFEVAHMPSNPNSARAVSMIAGVISTMPRSRA